MIHGRTNASHYQSQEVAIENVGHHKACVDELVEAADEVVELRILAHRRAVYSRAY